VAEDQRHDVIVNYSSTAGEQAPGSRGTPHVGQPAARHVQVRSLGAAEMTPSRYSL
jgi:hypothetical protein